MKFRSMMLKAVLVAALWFIVALLMTNGGARNAIAGGPQAVQYDEAEPNALKAVKPTPSKKRSESSNANNLYDGLGVIAAPGSDNAPGELGKPVVLPKNISEETKQAVAEGWKKHSFNQYVSDLISIRRKLPDPRDEWCKQSDRYLEDLPQTSVVICFHNEAWTVLLRTVHSVLDRSPPHLIKEIVLVDDFSDMLYLKQQLDNYMSFLPKVRIVHTTRREGLIRARLLGARLSTAPVLTFLDSHCECAEGWLEPLLDRIARNKTTVVCPKIDWIHHKTLEFRFKTSVTYVGGFDWTLSYTWHAVPARERARHKHTAEPVWSPTMAGGLFAIDKEFFEHLGTYDSDLDIWGGENLELSFKTWMCGGTLEIVPCSHVGHIYRTTSPYTVRSDVVTKNLVRVAKVWLDDYAKYFYQRIKIHIEDYGDISSRVALRDKLGCKSFEWYLKNIYPELFIPENTVAQGQIANFKTRMCLEPRYNLDLRYDELPLHKLVIVWPCHGQSGNQYWLYTKTGEIRHDHWCLDYSERDVVFYYCHGAKGNQMWLYDPQTKLLRHDYSGKCLTVNKPKDKVVMQACNDENEQQKWHMENFYPDRLNPKLIDE